MVKDGQGYDPPVILTKFNPKRATSIVHSARDFTLTISRLPGSLFFSLFKILGMFRSDRCRTEGHAYACTRGCDMCRRGGVGVTFGVPSVAVGRGHMRERVPSLPLRRLELLGAFAT